MHNPLDLINDGCTLALKLLLRVSDQPTGNLRTDGGVYGFGSGPSFHALEAALVGTAVTGDWRADVASVLGVSPAWVQGFIDGFANTAETSTETDYMDGYSYGGGLRTRRFEKWLRHT